MKTNRPEERYESMPLSFQAGRQTAIPPGARGGSLSDWTAGLAASEVQLSTLDAALVQFRHAVAARQTGGDGLHAIAAQGATGPASSLPHLDVVQRAFGHHDISAVQCYQGAAATAATDALGARAYAADGKVVLGRTGTDLHTVAHEAAHVVQQRGGVALSGGLGRVGDAYERHADAVADLVVQGKSAESLLTAAPGGGPATQRVVQADSGFSMVPTEDDDARDEWVSELGTYEDDAPQQAEDQAPAPAQAQNQAAGGIDDPKWERYRQAHSSGVAQAQQTVAEHQNQKTVKILERHGGRLPAELARRLANRFSVCRPNETDEQREARMRQEEEQIIAEYWAQNGGPEARRRFENSKHGIETDGVDGKPMSKNAITAEEWEKRQQQLLKDLDWVTSNPIGGGFYGVHRTHTSHEDAMFRARQIQGVFDAVSAGAGARNPQGNARTNHRPFQGPNTPTTTHQPH